jgi:hypothetical protein
MVICDYVKIIAEEYEADEEMVNICHLMLNLLFSFYFIFYLFGIFYYLKLKDFITV